VLYLLQKQSVKHFLIASPKIFVALFNSGTQYLQQSYKVSDSFPFKWINKKWREGFYVTAMATAGSRWAIVMSRGTGFSDQVTFVNL
jgi:hypothetical protein